MHFHSSPCWTPKMSHLNVISGVSKICCKASYMWHERPGSPRPIPSLCYATFSFGLSTQTFSYCKCPLETHFSITLMKGRIKVLLFILYSGSFSPNAVVFHKYSITMHTRQKAPAGLCCLNRQFSTWRSRPLWS